MIENKKNIAVVYSHHKAGDLIWQLPYIKSISNFHKLKITLITRSKTQAKDIFKDENFIKDFFYCEFRKKIWYFVEIIKLYLFFKKKNFSHIYILDKISRPAIAAKLAGLKNIIGPGIKNQKFWLTCENYLSYDDYKNLNYSDQSEKFLKLNNILIFDRVPKINLTSQSLDSIEPKLNNKKIISFGVDSFELYKIWYEDQFADLAERLFSKNLCENFFLISSKNNQHIVKKIISLSKMNIFHDCSSLNLLQIIKVIKNSIFFVGNNSAPLNIASAVNTMAFGLITNAKVSELKNTKIDPILPENYTDQFIKKREIMRTLTVDRVYNHILNKIT